MLIDTNLIIKKSSFSNNFPSGSEFTVKKVLVLANYFVVFCKGLYLNVKKFLMCVLSKLTFICILRIILVVKYSTNLSYIKFKLKK